MTEEANLAKLCFQVTHQDTASTVMSGSLPVLATPRLAAWMERTAVLACDNLLAEGETTVGSQLSIEHTSPSPIGSTIQIRASLLTTQSRRIDLKITAQDDAGPIASATHTRYIVDETRFMEKALSRKPSK